MLQNQWKKKNNIFFIIITFIVLGYIGTNIRIRIVSAYSQATNPLRNFCYSPHNNNINNNANQYYNPYHNNHEQKQLSVTKNNRNPHTNGGCFGGFHLFSSFKNQNVIQQQQQQQDDNDDNQFISKQKQGQQQQQKEETSVQSNVQLHDNNNVKSSQHQLQRRSLFRQVMMATTTAAITTATTTIPFTNDGGGSIANAIMTKESYWPLWTALPVAPYNRRRTIRTQITKDVWIFDQLIGIYYVQVPIRMTIVKISTTGTKNSTTGLVVYAPVAPTKECIRLVNELILQHGPIVHIILPTVAVEHKINAGPFARAYPNANFYVTDQQYSFPLNLPDRFLGLPSWTQKLPQSSSSISSSTSSSESMWGPDLVHDVLTVQPGIASMYQDVAMYHKPSKTMLLCDTIFAVDGTPPRILTDEEEYTRALLFHARDNKDDIVPDTIENRQKGWRRIVLLFNFFFPGSGKGDLSIGPILEALKTPFYKDGWGGWKPFTWNTIDEIRDFEVFSNKGKPTILPIIQIILSRNVPEVVRWLKVVQQWDFQRVIPMHLDAPLKLNSKQFTEPFQLFTSTNSQTNAVRFCDEDVEFLRYAEEGFLKFTVYPTKLGALRGKDGPCGLTRPP